MDSLLKEDNFHQKKLNNLSLSNRSIRSKSFEECRFKRCSFVSCTFEKCRFIECHFVDCVLSAIKPVNSYFSDVSFKDSKVMGFDWTKTRDVKSLIFDHCDISYSNFSHLKLPQLQLTDSVAKEVSFIEASLKEGKFTGTDFKKALFHKTDLTKADFRKAKNYLIDFRHNVLKKAKFSFPEAIDLLKCLNIVVDY